MKSALKQKQQLKHECFRRSRIITGEVSAVLRSMLWQCSLCQVLKWKLFLAFKGPAYFNVMTEIGLPQKQELLQDLASCAAWYSLKSWHHIC